MCRNIFNCSVSWAERERDNAAANLTQMKAHTAFRIGCKGVKLCSDFFTKHHNPTPPPPQHSDLYLYSYTEQINPVGWPTFNIHHCYTMTM